MFFSFNNSFRVISIQLSNRIFSPKMNPKPRINAISNKCIYTTNTFNTPFFGL